MQTLPLIHGKPGQVHGKPGQVTQIILICADRGGGGADPVSN
ncbi:MAG TPA: hypothetical protein VFW31_19480 [Candidatus Angelobacter sp.]|nr:hypothetical protein [Candidatus Angelobacter sp.]